MDTRFNKIENCIENMQCEMNTGFTGVKASITSMEASMEASTAARIAGMEASMAAKIAGMEARFTNMYAVNAWDDIKPVQYTDKDVWKWHPDRVVKLWRLQYVQSHRHRGLYHPFRCNNAPLTSHS
jgi:hypothetical protein